MKKDGAHSRRILGRQLARELAREELNGGLWATTTFRWPPDLDPGWPQVRL